MEFSENNIIKWAANIDQYFRSFQHEDDSVNNTELFKAYLDTVAEILTQVLIKRPPKITGNYPSWEIF